MGTKIRAYVLRSISKLPDLENLEMPAELIPGQVMVRLLYSSICPTQVSQIFEGGKNEAYLPHLLGHEGVGIVEGLGRTNSKYQIGQIVVLHWRPNISKFQDRPVAYISDYGKVNSGPVATFAESVIVSENRITILPSGVPLEKASLFGCALTTGFGAVMNEARISAGSRALVLGAGSIGTAVIQACFSEGAGYICAVEPNLDAQNRARSAGANSTVSTLDELLDVTSSSEPGKFIEDFNFVFDTTGNAALINQVTKSVGKNCRIVFIGMPKVGAVMDLPLRSMLDGLELIGSNGGSVIPERDIPKIVHKFRNEICKFEDNQIEIVDFESLGDAIIKVRQGFNKKYVIKFSS